MTSLTPLRFVAIPTETARSYQALGADAYGAAPEKRISDGSALPCRHCLSDIEAGAEYLVLAHRPFSRTQAFAETGPIFVHAAECVRHPEVGATPAMFLKRKQMLVRGYDADERIVYGTGVIVPTAEVSDAAAAILERPDVAFVHLRSAGYNCFQCRVERA